MTADGEVNDSELVRAASCGDLLAFGMLLERHRPLVLGLCRRVLRDPGLAEDAAQEAALQAFLSMDRLRQPERFGSWLGGIGLNICRHWLRDQARDVWSLDTLYGGRQILEPFDDDPGVDPAVVAEEAELRQTVHQAVAGLPEGQRAAVMLFYMSGLTHMETAHMLGIRVGAVKTRLHNGRAALRTRLWNVWKEHKMETTVASDLVEMRVANVWRLSAEGDLPRRHVVMLAEVGGARRFQIWIGQQEGHALALHLEHVELPRPFAHDLIVSLVHAVGGHVREVRITRLADTTFYAEIVVEGPQGVQSVDARPSDALNVALLANVPIRVATAVLEETAVSGPDTVPPASAEGTTSIVADIKANWYGPGKPLDQPSSPADPC